MSDGLAPHQGGVAVRRAYVGRRETPPRRRAVRRNQQDGAGLIIIVVGEFDMTGTEQFWAHVNEAVEARPVSITVEARGLTFVDSSGLAAMMRAHEAATRPA